MLQILLYLKASGGFSSSNSSFGMLREYLGNTGYVNVYSITSAGGKEQLIEII